MQSTGKGPMDEYARAVEAGSRGSTPGRTPFAIVQILDLHGNIVLLGGCHHSRLRLAAGHFQRWKRGAAVSDRGIGVGSHLTLHHPSVGASPGVAAIGHHSGTERATGANSDKPDGR